MYQIVSSKILYANADDSVLSQYLKDISKYPILSIEEINHLIDEAHAGNDSAKNRVIECNLRFVVTVAKQYQGRGLPLMDLISEGNLGLAHAIDLFDTSRGVPFLGYASWWIRQSIGQAVFWRGREIRLPVSQHVKIIAILKARKRLEQEYGRIPSPKEISELTNIPEEQINFLAQYFTSMVSVDDFIGGDEDNNQVCDIIPDKSMKPLEDIVDGGLINKELIHVLDKLTTRERDILVMLFGINMEPVDNKTVAAMYGIGTERIRQIKEGALQKLRTIYAKELNKLL